MRCVIQSTHKEYKTKGGAASRFPIVKAAAPEMSCQGLFNQTSIGEENIRDDICCKFRRDKKSYNLSDCFFLRKKQGQEAVINS